MAPEVDTPVLTSKDEVYDEMAIYLMAQWRNATRRMSLTLKEMDPEGRQQRILRPDNLRAIGTMESYIRDRLWDIVRETNKFSELECAMHFDVLSDDWTIEIRVKSISSGAEYFIREPLKGFPTDSLLGKLMIFA